MAKCCRGFTTKDMEFPPHLILKRRLCWPWELLRQINGKNRPTVGAEAMRCR